MKLPTKFFGPFQILKIGSVAYRLQLPDHSKLHCIPYFTVEEVQRQPTGQCIPIARIQLRGSVSFSS